MVGRGVPVDFGKHGRHPSFVLHECAVPMVHSGDLKVNGSGGEVIIHKVCFSPGGLSWCPSIALSLL